VATLLAACGSDEATEGGGDAVDATGSFACTVSQAFPYPANSSYVGVHANPSNNDFIPCETASQYTEEWHALQGFGVVQPNTFSPDGAVTYIATTNPLPDDCTVHALRVSDGTELWCRHIPEARASAVEVDLDGNLYVTSKEAVVSLTDSGVTRWETPMPPAAAPDQINGAIGLHLTPTGHVATVTNGGTVLLLARDDGRILASLDIPETYGFVPASTLATTLDLQELMPPEVLADFQSLQDAESGAFLDAFAGTGTNFSDNTLGISLAGDLYVIGGGPDPEHGALVQILVLGSAESPSLAPGWYVETVNGSASSPAISPDGRYVKIADGNTSIALIAPESADASLRIADIEACNENSDEDPDPDRCEPILVIPLATGPMMGTSPLLDGPVHYNYETQIGNMYDQSEPDIRAYEGGELLWDLHLPDDRIWSSVITVTQNHLIGTATALTPSNEYLLTIRLPSTAESRLFVIDRASGDIVFDAPVTDDSAATVTVGPDGSLYVAILALLHSFAVDTRPVAGVIRFAPQNRP
jgi:hypothetical protein